MRESQPTLTQQTTRLTKDQLLLTAEEAADMLRVGRTTVYSLMKQGELRAVHIGRSCRIARTELERYVTGLNASTSEAGSAGLSTDF